MILAAFTYVQNNALAIAGLVLAVCAIAWPIYQFFKQQRYRGAISFAAEKQIPLFHGLVQDFEEIEISYKQERINGRLILVKGYVVNSGIEDLHAGLVCEPLMAELPEGMNWRQVHVEDPEGKATTKFSFGGRSLQFDLAPLFKRNECMRFSALVVAPSDVAKVKLTWRHRIRDFLADIKEHDLSEDFFEHPVGWQKRCVAILIALMFVVFGAYTTYVSLTSIADAVGFKEKSLVPGMGAIALRTDVWGNIHAIDDAGVRIDIDVSESFSEGSWVPTVLKSKRKMLLNGLAPAWSFVGAFLVLSTVFYFPWTKRGRVKRAIDRHKRRARARSANGPNKAKQSGRG